jgi:glycosyltransferase involved in cell wall biosynthesis
MQNGDSPFHESNRPPEFQPVFSVCIPQYNRTDFLIRSIDTFRSQEFRDFELCISDDCSTDGKQSLFLEYLKSSGLVFVYARTKQRLRYDGNLRNAIALSKGRYLLLMGNDDELTGTDTLRVLHDELERFRPVAVAVTNYRELGSGRVDRRTAETKLLGSGPRVAARTFRGYSFLSGVVLQGDAARKAATDVCDGSEMYQMYLGTRLVAEGGYYLGINRLCINKDIQIPGQAVDSYRPHQRLRPCPIVERRLPMGRLLEVVATGLEPYHTGVDRERNLLCVATQLYRFTYPFWIIEYRRVQSWRYAVGVLLALRPTVTAKRVALSRASAFRMWLLYILGGAIALILPITLFDFLRPRLYAVAKRVYSA